MKELHTEEYKVWSSELAKLLKPYALVRITKSDLKLIRSLYRKGLTPKDCCGFVLLSK